VVSTSLFLLGDSIALGDSNHVNRFSERETKLVAREQHFLNQTRKPSEQWAGFARKIAKCSAFRHHRKVEASGVFESASQYR